MTVGKRLTVADYEKALRGALGQCTVTLHEFFDGTMGDYDPKTYAIRLDPHWGALIPTLIHELMHHVHYHKLAGMGEMEEPTTEAWEAAVSANIFKSPRKEAWWRKALHAKIKEGE